MEDVPRKGFRVFLHDLRADPVRTHLPMGHQLQFTTDIGIGISAAFVDVVERNR
jgi:hypothetical protein